MMSWTMQGLKKRETSTKFNTHPATAGGGAGHIISYQTTFVKFYYDRSKNFPDPWPNLITKSIKISRFLTKPYISNLISNKPYFLISGV